MNKSELKLFLPKAYCILKDYKVEDHYKLFETQLKTFGSAMAMGNIGMAKKLFSDRFREENTSKVKNVYLARRNILCMWQEMLEKIGGDKDNPSLSDSKKALTFLRIGLLYFKKPVDSKLKKQEENKTSDQPESTETNQKVAKIRKFKDCRLPNDFFNNFHIKDARDSRNLSYRFYAGNFDDFTHILRNYKGIKEEKILPSQIENPYSSLIAGIKDCSDNCGVYFDEETGFGCFKLKVTYPGLVTGLGILYENSAEKGIKSGFSFDYNTGLPFIQGSNVKGRLKSICEALSATESDEAKESLAETIQIETFDTIITALSEKDSLRMAISNANGDYFKEGLSEFIKDCFGGEGQEEKGNDIFFDAFAERVDCIDEDFVTKHDKDNLKEPNPARFWRIKPDTEMTFIFKLTDYKKGDCEISAKAKLALFKQLLKDYGIGAKTNKGYGYLKE